MDGIWSQTNGSSMDFNRDKVLLQLFSHNFSVVPCNLHSSVLQTERQEHAKLAEMPLHIPVVSLFKDKRGIYKQQSLLEACHNLTGKHELEEYSNIINFR